MWLSRGLRDFLVSAGHISFFFTALGSGRCGMPLVRGTIESYIGKARVGGVYIAVSLNREQGVRPLMLWAHRLVSLCCHTQCIFHPLRVPCTGLHCHWHVGWPLFK